MELYVHIPFCKKKCRYCSFTSYVGREDYYEKYIDLILREALIRQDEVTEPFKTVYVGGGTPSVLSPPQFHRLIDGLHSILGLESVTEFTVEANPGTVTRQWLDTAAQNGVNRISFGVQAIQDRLLKILGRIHRYEEVVSSLDLARISGIRNISLDLIFGIPTQTINEWEQTLDAILSLNPLHFSAYGLIPEPGTEIYRDLENGDLQLPDPDDERSMYNLVIQKSAANGFHQYEISNFAQNDCECQHNIGYWTQIPYLGLGVSAASMYGLQICEDGMSYIRSVNPDTFDSYELMLKDRSSFHFYERIIPAEARFETMMLGFRMNRGINEKDFLMKHHLSIAYCYGEKLKKLEQEGLVIHKKGVWKLSARGFDIQNSVLVELMDD